MTDIYTIFNHNHAYGNFELFQLLVIMSFDIALIFYSISFVWFFLKMIRNSMSWFLRPRWPLSMVFIQNVSIKVAAVHIS